MIYKCALSSLVELQNDSASKNTMMCLEQVTNAADAYLACLHLMKEILTVIQHILHNLLAN